MGSNLSFVMPLLRCLNQSEDLRMNYRLLCKRLEVTVEVLQEIAELVNEMEPLLYQDGEDLVLSMPRTFMRRYLLVAASS